MNNTPTLHQIVKNSYAKNKANQMGGYEYDQQLSNHNHQVYYNPKDKKLLFSVTGSHNASDWLNNIKLGLGYGFKQSNRYKESHQNIILIMLQLLVILKEDIRPSIFQVQVIRY